MMPNFYKIVIGIQKLGVNDSQTNEINLPRYLKLPSTNSVMHT